MESRKNSENSGLKRDFFCEDLLRKETTFHVCKPSSALSEYGSWRQSPTVLAVKQRHREVILVLP